MIDDVFTNCDPLRMKQVRLASLGNRVLGSVSAFNLWLDVPERRELFTSEAGLDILEEMLKIIDEGVW